MTNSVTLIERPGGFLLENRKQRFLGKFEVYFIEFCIIYMCKTTQFLGHLILLIMPNYPVLIPTVLTLELWSSHGRALVLK